MHVICLRKLRRPYQMWSNHRRRVIVRRWQQPPCHLLFQRMFRTRLRGTSDRITLDNSTNRFVPTVVVPPSLPAPTCTAVLNVPSSDRFCGIRGQDSGSATYYFSGNTDTEGGCATACLNDRRCFSYIYGSAESSTACKLTDVTPVFYDAPDSPTVFSRRLCFTCVPI